LKEIKLLFNSTKLINKKKETEAEKASIATQLDILNQKISDLEINITSLQQEKDQMKIDYENLEAKNKALQIELNTMREAQSLLEISISEQVEVGKENPMLNQLTQFKVQYQQLKDQIATLNEQIVILKKQALDKKSNKKDDIELDGNHALLQNSLELEKTT